MKLVAYAPLRDICTQLAHWMMLEAKKRELLLTPKVSCVASESAFSKMSRGESDQTKQTKLGGQKEKIRLTANISPRLAPLVRARHGLARRHEVYLPDKVSRVTCSGQKSKKQLYNPWYDSIKLCVLQPPLKMRRTRKPN